ncbi:MAG: glycosyltransferase [bacterium]|nr:glycosyltransferase [bacterium]
MTALKVISPGAHGIALAEDDIAVFLADDVQLDPRACEIILSAFNQYPEAEALYWDVMVDGHRWARPAWSPTRVLSEPGVTLPLAFRSSWTGFDISAAPQELEGRLASSNALVLHIPTVLTRHSRTPAEGVPDSDDLRYEPGPRPGTRRLRPSARGQSSTSIIIPSAGRARPGEDTSMLSRCLETLAQLEPRPKEVIVVVGDEFEGEPPQRVDKLPIRIKHRGTGSFHFSSAINCGLSASRGEFVLLLNDDIEAEGSDWLGRMAAHLDDPTVGAVGAALLYSDRTVQHAGVVIEGAHPYHPFWNYSLADTAPFGGDVARDVIAVTGACLLARRSDLLAVGGMSPEFPVSFGDVDLCLRLRQFGRRVVVEPAALLLHHESASRERVIEPWEWDRFHGRWGGIEDPWYHPAYWRPNNPDYMNHNADHLAPVDAEGSWPIRTAELRPNPPSVPSKMNSPSGGDLTRIQQEIQVEAEIRRRHDSEIVRLESELITIWDEIVPSKAVNSDDIIPHAESVPLSFDANPPLGNQPIGRYIKRVIRKTVRWTLHHLVAQMNHLSRTLDRRLNEIEAHAHHQNKLLEYQNTRIAHLEQSLQMPIDNHYLVTSDFLALPSDPSSDVISRIVEYVQPGPCLVLSGGCGNIVKSICDNGGAAYGVEPDKGSVIIAMQNDIDIRLDDMISHMASIHDKEFDTIVLANAIEILPFGCIVDLIVEARRLLNGNGRIVVAVADPAIRNPIESELHNGLGISPATWQYLLQQAGFDVRREEVSDSRITQLVIADFLSDKEPTTPTSTSSTDPSERFQTNLQ